MDQKVQKCWEEFLNPDVLRPRLISAAIYIAGFESLKDAIITRIRDFFYNGLDKSGGRLDAAYQSKVLSRNKSALYASLDWLKNEVNAIDDADISAFDRVKTCRNFLSHELLALLGTEGLPPDFEKCFDEMVSLLHKIDVWWIINVESPTNPDFDGEDIDYDGIKSGRVMGLQLLCDIALGDPVRSTFYFEKFRKRKTGSGA